MSKSNSVTDKTLSEAGLKKLARQGKQDSPQHKYKKASHIARGGEADDTRRKRVPDYVPGFSYKKHKQGKLKATKVMRRMEKDRKKVNSSVLPFIGMTLSEAGIKKMERQGKKNTPQYKYKKAQRKKRAEAQLQKNWDPRKGPSTIPRAKAHLAMYDSILPFVGMTLSEAGIRKMKRQGKENTPQYKYKKAQGKRRDAEARAEATGRAAMRAGMYDSVLPFIGMTLSEVYNLVEKRYDDEGNPIPAHKRSFAVGKKMAEREFKDSKTAKANKARREKLKKSGIKGAGSVSAGMAHRSKELRGER